MRQFIYTGTILFCMLLSSNAQTWTPRANLPGMGRLAAFVFSINSKIYMGGGSGYKDFWEYDPLLDVWTEKAGIPGVNISRSFGVAFAIQGKGYIGLGLDNWPAVASDDKKDLWEYNPASNTWQAKADLPAVARSGCASMVIDNKGYVLAGADQTSPLAEVWAFDPVTGTWARKADLPSGGLYNPIAFTAAGTGYFTCGSTSSGSASAKTYAFNPATDQWVAKADFAGDFRDAGLAFEKDGMAYIGLGASSDYSTFYNDFWKYDPSSDVWSLGPVLPGAKRAFALSTVVNNRVFVGAGWNYNNGSEQYFKDWYELQSSTGVEPMFISPLQLYPIPATTHLKLARMYFMGTYSYAIHNLMGKLLLTGASSADGQVDISTLPAGVYLFEVSSDKQHYTSRFLKQ